MMTEETRPEIVIQGQTYVLIGPTEVGNLWMEYDNGNDDYGFVHPVFGELTLEHLRDLQEKADALTLEST